MFLFTYLRRELKHRLRQSLVVSLGLALGVGLVIAVTAAASGVRDAQGGVLHGLYGTGTDVTVTEAPPAGSGAFRALINGGLPRAGAQFDREALISQQFGTMNAATTASITQLGRVARAGGGLMLTDLSVSGIFPGFGGGGGSGSAPSLSTSTYSVNGVDLSTPGVGQLSAGTITSGHGFTSADASSNVAVLDSSYAQRTKLTTGSDFKLAGTTFTVIGLASLPPSASSDVYIPLQRAQSLSGLSGKINIVYVTADSSADVGAVSSEIAKRVPAATVASSSDLANEVTGSVTSAASLANNLGKWLAVAVLIAAFCVASLLTMSAVTRRVREFGTLKALGWRSRRIVGQVMSEALAQGLAGGVAGIGLGFGAAALITRLAPPLSASTGAAATPTAPPGGGMPGSGALRQAVGKVAAHTVTVHLTAPVTLDAVLLAVVLAIAGGLIAGSLGSWRAVRLRPATALARVA